MKPYWGKPTVRHLREGAGNVGYGGIRNPLHNRKGACRSLSTYGCARLCSTRPDASQIPAMVEPWLLAFNARIELHPVMVPEDLLKAGSAFEATVKKYS